MKVLFVAFEFPPVGGGGVQRSMKFAQYLPDFGIEPVVITTDGGSFQKVMPNPLDLSLLKQLPKKLSVERIPCPRIYPAPKSNLGTWFKMYFSLVEDVATHWRPQLEKALPSIIKQYEPKAIVVSIPPFCMGPLWCELAEQFKLPFILDMRDAWSQWHIGPYGSWLHYFLTLRLERRCLQGAARVICTSDQTRSDLLKVHPNVPTDKVAVITNGYDAEIKDWSICADGERSTLRIGYVGNFYYFPAARETLMRAWWRKRPNRMIQYSHRKEDWLYRSPYFFFRAVARMLATYPDCRQRLRICFAGQKPDWIDGQIDEFGLEDIVEFTGLLDHASVLKFQETCDALLVTSSKVIGGKDYSIAGKTFEYFTIRKPIIAFVAEGAQKDLLAASGLALLCDPDNIEESATKLHELFSSSVRFTPNPQFLRKLHRRELTRHLADIICDAVGDLQSVAGVTETGMCV